MGLFKIHGSKKTLDYKMTHRLFTSIISNNLTSSLLHFLSNLYSLLYRLSHKCPKGQLWPGESSVHQYFMYMWLCISFSHATQIRYYYYYSYIIIHYYVIKRVACTIAHLHKPSSCPDHRIALDHVLFPTSILFQFVDMLQIDRLSAISNLLKLYCYNFFQIDCWNLLQIKWSK